METDGSVAILVAALCSFEAFLFICLVFSLLSTSDPNWKFTDDVLIENFYAVLCLMHSFCENANHFIRICMSIRMPIGIQDVWQTTLCMEDKKKKFPIEPDHHDLLSGNWPL